MAARKITRLTDDWREKIRTSMLINRLQDNAEGKIELTNTQVKSIEILLRKTAPDLTSATLDAGDGLKEALAGIKVTFGS